MNLIYDEIVHWRKNIFLLPSGSSGKCFVKEMTRLINFWNNDVCHFKDVALKLLMIMPALLLQKPKYKSKTKQHAECLTRRMMKWENGEFDELLRECKVIQSKIPSSSDKQQTSDHIAKSFAKLNSLQRMLVVTYWMFKLGYCLRFRRN